MKKATQPSHNPLVKRLSTVATLFAPLSLLAGIFSAIYLTFSVAGSSVSKAEYTAALNILAMLSVANITFAVATGWRKAMSSTVIATLLAVLAVSMALNIPEGDLFSPVDYADATAITWLIASVIIAAPIIILSGYLAMIKRANLRQAVIGILVGVLLVVLFSLSLSIDQQAREAYGFLIQ